LRPRHRARGRQIYGLGEVQEAYEALAAGKSHFGKLAIRLDFEE